MGCGSSKRPFSARSWMAHEGWAPEKYKEEDHSPSRTGSGKLRVEDTAVNKEINNNEVRPKLEETRRVGSCSVGLSVRPFTF